MKLEGLNNEYRSGDGEVKKIIPLGYIGSEDLAKAGEERLKENGFYYLKDDGWHTNASGWLPEIFYGIEERDFHLFEAYDYLEEDWELIGYGTGEKQDDSFDYAYFRISSQSFIMIDDKACYKNQIYARRKKEEKPSDVLKLTNGSPDKMYIPLKIATYEKLKNICSKEGKTLSEKISEWVEGDKAQKKAKRSREEVMRDIKKELEDAWSEEESPEEMVKGAEFLLDLITEGGMKFK